jgi:signal peptidase I
MDFNNIENQDKDKKFEKFDVKSEDRKPNYLYEFFKWFLFIIVSIIITLVIRAFVFEWVIVQGRSMENTLYDRQVLYVNKIGYYIGSPKRGDIVVFEVIKGNLDYFPLAKNIPVLSSLLPPQKEVDYIKRVIGLPGDKVDIIDNKVYINGIMQNETYAKGTTWKQSFEMPCTVPENKVFVMGDNRENSKDSRMIGFVEIDKIKGKAEFRIRPIKEFGSLYD